MSYTIKYPDNIFDASTEYQVDGVDDADADDINKVYDEIEMIETELGTNAKKGGISIDGWDTVSQGIILKGTTSQRTSSSISYKNGQVFSDITNGNLYKRSADGLGNDGNWDLITASGSPGTHASTHLPASGYDALTCGTTGTISPDDSASEGTADSFARSDHTHAITCGIPSDVGDANAEGSSSSFARQDHVHATHTNTPTSDEKAALAGEGTPSASNKYTTKSYVDAEVSAAAGLCLVAGNETVVSTTSTSATTVKDHMLLNTSTVLSITTIYVAAELQTDDASATATLEVHINGSARITLTSTSTTYELKAGSWTVSGLSDNTVYTVEVKLKTSNASYSAYNRAYEFYIK